MAVIVTDQPAFECWAIVEVMGHRRFAGYVTEQVIAGQGFVRIDVPEAGGRPAFTKILGAGSIYAITPVTEDTAREAAASFREMPLQAWDLPERPALPGPRRDEDDDEYEGQPEQGIDY